MSRVSGFLAAVLTGLAVFVFMLREVERSERSRGESTTPEAGLLPDAGGERP